MRLGKSYSLFTVLMILAITFSFQTSGSAAGPTKAWKAKALKPDSTFTADLAKPARGATKTDASGKLVSVIVKLKGEPLSTYGGGISGLAPTSPEDTGKPQLDFTSKDSQAYLQYLGKRQDEFRAALLKAVPKARITYRYDVVVNGAAVLVPPDQIPNLAKLPGVEAVYPDQMLHLDTDNSPEFIGATSV